MLQTNYIYSPNAALTNILLNDRIDLNLKCCYRRTKLSGEATHLECNSSSRVEYFCVMAVVHKVFFLTLVKVVKNQVKNAFIVR